LGRQRKENSTEEQGGFFIPGKKKSCRRFADILILFIDLICESAAEYFSERN
jgi:hypothetical protein